MTLPTHNTAWGFYGSIQHHADPDEACRSMQPIMTATGFSEEAVRDFFADDVAQRLFEGLPLSSAIDAAVERWMNWHTNSNMQAQSGIPVGLPYLVGLLGDREIENEINAT